MFRSKRDLFAALGFAMAFVTPACGDDLPSPTLIDDLRVLAVRAEPPEVLVDRVDGEPSPPGPVSLQALVVDPRGGAMTYAWRFCPVESQQTCADFADRRAGAPPEFQATLDAAHAQQHAGAVGGATGAARAIEGFGIEVPRALFSYHLATSGLGVGNGSWISAVLETTSAGQTLQVQKRVVLGARDLAQWNPELQRFGWQVCAAGAAGPGCVPLAPRTANHNPEIAALEIARGARADAAFTPLAAEPGPLRLTAGEVIRLRPVMAPGAEEPYQTVEATLQTSALVVVDRREETVISWFTTAGKFGAAQTTAQLTKTLDNTFTAPTTPPPDAKLSLFVVARDQRGGVAWTTLDAVVQNPAPPAGF